MSKSNTKRVTLSFEQLGEAIFLHLTFPVSLPIIGAFDVPSIPLTIGGLRFSIGGTLSENENSGTVAINVMIDTLQSLSNR